MKRFATMLGALAIFAAPSAGIARAAEGPVSVTPASYRLGAGDRLKITVYGEDKLSGEYGIGGDGRIAFPLIGPVVAGGLTIGELTAMLARVLGNGYMLHPDVTAEVISFRPVFILGEVEKPGQYPYAEHMTIYTLVAQAGGFTYRAKHKRIGIRHEGDAIEQKLSVTNATTVRPGDTIRTLERNF